jgi:hypothetical protein
MSRIHIRTALALAAATLALSGLAGCSCSTEPGAGDGDGGTGPGIDGEVPDIDAALPPADGGPGVVVTEDGGFTWTCRPTQCGGRFTECGDCSDNDGDGLVDSRDRECLGPCDNTEGPALLAGVGGETGGPCRSDCYFDFGNGPGNDDCFWDHRCDPLAVDPGFHPEGPTCPYDDSRVGSRDCPDMQSDTCFDVCRPLTPAGCDCFGCCTFDEIADRDPSEGGTHVWLGSVVEGTNTGTCTFDVIEDTSLCRPCTPVADCYNGCGRCELCIGRTELPPDCFPPDGGLPDAALPDGGYMPRCEGGEQPCGLPGEADCPTDFYCISGCCQPTLI